MTYANTYTIHKMYINDIHNNISEHKTIRSKVINVKYKTH